jgi:hypothetical protein
MSHIEKPPENTITTIAPNGNHVGMEIWPSREWSEWLYDCANIALIGALIVGAVATVTVVWMGNKKEEYLKRDVAGAQLRGDEANARAKEAELALERFKAPRIMTEAQARHFIEEASKYSGTQADIWIIGDTPEPIGIGQIIFRLLEISGWKTVSWNWAGGGAVMGIAVIVKEASGSDIDKAANFLVDSLNAVGIVSTRQNWGIDWDKFPGMLNGPPFSADKTAPIRIIIGAKPQ